ncbi:pyrroloquinoline quinone biosynthesis protein PqqB [Amycolatopsis nigrescens]|uniref:pyrroloquinoline quinone biosynthesis protein PqqB n=1 Tax=Amycolatopsis nigrescens TaxID=381445 RepID=UPI00037655CE|nr:pyrroloquinoline quinone biosynthesis protein PqqB [Amycolatopsis nigrescens]
MKVLLLGTAAGGGFPQWNCACRLCKSGAPARGQDCIAVSAGEGWYLINASPDIRAQVLACPALAAGPGPRDTPIRGALLTDGELDHTLGLLMLREGAGLQVWAPSTVRQALNEGFPLRGLVDAYGNWQWSPVHQGTEFGGLRVHVLPVGDKRPKYARSSDATGPWVVAYRIEDPATGGALVYAPCLASWPPGFDEFTAGAGLVLLDGTFYSADEMSGATSGGAAHLEQSVMGHLPIAGPSGSLAQIRRLRAARPDVRWAYTHLNNTNPVLDPASPEHAAVLASGVTLPEDGTIYKL